MSSMSASDSEHFKNVYTYYCVVVYRFPSDSLLICHHQQLVYCKNVNIICTLVLYAPVLRNAGVTQQ